MRTFLLLDVHNLFHRCKHVTSGDMELRVGMSLHIILNSIKKMWKDYKIDHVVACLEGGSWRKKIYPEYKANRKLLENLKTPKELKEDELYFKAMDEFIDFLREKTNITLLKQKYVEADDFIARWIQLHPDDNHVILTSDSDFYQLLSDNVKIYDGVKGWLITNKEVLNEKGQRAFKVKNIKDKSTKRVKKEKTFIDPPNPEYELFRKCIRGDSSDNIMTAYPKAREKGTMKKPGILDAYEDRINKGIIWNEFMLHEWDKAISHSEDEDGNIEIITKKVTVKEEYELNRTLIDLTLQPKEIKESMDLIIMEQIQKPLIPQVGVNFIRYANKMDLKMIVSNPNEIAKALSSKY